MSGIQIVGNTNVSTAAEVEVSTKAIRSVIRPDDYGSLGMYSVGGTSGTIAAGSYTSAAAAFSFRYPAANICVVKRILLTAVGGSTAFTAGTGKAELFVARSYTVAETTGTGAVDLSPTGNFTKLRTSMATTGTTTTRSIFIAGTATISGGTRTIDTQALASIGFVCSATANTVMIPQATELWYQRAGEYPLVFAQNEGFLIFFTTTATGTFVFSVSVHWEELAAY